MDSAQAYKGVILQANDVPLSILESRAEHLRSSLSDLGVEIKAVDSLDKLNGDMGKYSLFFIGEDYFAGRALMEYRAMHPHVEVVLWWSDPRTGIGVSEVIPVRGPSASGGIWHLKENEWQQVIPNIARAYFSNHSLSTYFALEELLVQQSKAGYAKK